MRLSFVLMAMFAASLAGAAGDYEEQRELNLDAGDIDRLLIDSGAGSLTVRGEAGLAEIRVTATIEVPDDDDARERIEEDMVLSLEKRGDTAVLKAWFDNGMWRFGDSPRVNLEVRIPEGLDLGVDDGSGSIDVDSVIGNLEVEDGSGSITLTNVGGSVDIDDGSGSIAANGVGGDLAIDDGSGSITVSGVGGSVIIDDGSGGIDVRDVEEDLVIVEGGSGGVDYADVRGSVIIDS